MAGNYDCDFCAIVRHAEEAREVFRSEEVVAFFPTQPATLGHTLVIPTSHVPDIWHLDVKTGDVLGRETMRIAHAIRNALQPEGLNVIQSNGAVATQTVLHVHIHLVPRWTGDAMGPIWPETTNWSETQKENAQSRLRAALADLGGEP